MPTSSQQNLQHYESISRLSEEMLAAARSGDWDNLAEAQRNCASAVDALRALPQPELDAAQVQRKTQIIRKVLAEDAEVRALTQPRLAELDVLLRGIQVQRNLGQAYR
jgi:flagellar protein FliT